jgi:hypothetical protein
MLEVMLAIMIFAMVLTAIYSTWLTILKGSKVSLEAAAAVQRSRIAFRAIEDALLTVQMYTANLGYYSFVGDESSLSMVSKLPASFPGVGRYGDQVVRRVSFYLDAGKDGMDELIMTQTPLLLDLRKGDVEPYTISLAKGVSTFSLVYWDPMKRDWVEQWVLTNQLPKMVQVTLGLGKQGQSSKPQDVVSRIMAVPSISVMPDLQAGPMMGGMMPTNRLDTNRFNFNRDPRFPLGDPRQGMNPGLMQ